MNQETRKELEELKEIWWKLIIEIRMWIVVNLISLCIELAPKSEEGKFTSAYLKFYFAELPNFLEKRGRFKESKEE